MITASLGLGKTESNIAAILKLIDGDHYGDGEFDKPLFPIRIEIRTPDHRIADELCRRFNARRPGVAVVWKGMEQPNGAGDGKMCLRTEDGALWRAAGGTQSAMCSQCPHGRKGENDCEYIHQVADTPVVITATPDGPTAATPRAVWRSVKVAGMNKSAVYGPDMIFLDETKPTAWVGGVDGKPVVFPADIFAGRLRPAIAPPSVDTTVIYGARPSPAGIRSH